MLHFLSECQCKDFKSKLSSLQRTRWGEGPLDAMFGQISIQGQKLVIFYSGCCAEIPQPLQRYRKIERRLLVFWYVLIVKYGHDFSYQSLDRKKGNEIDLIQKILFFGLCFLFLFQLSLCADRLCLCFPTHVLMLFFSQSSSGVLIILKQHISPHVHIFETLFGTEHSKGRSQYLCWLWMCH